MKTILICLAFCVAYCCATGLTIVDLPANTNTAVTGKLVGPAESTQLLYRVFLPRNASSITISIIQTDDVCEELILKGRTGQAPCPEDSDATYSICSAFTWTDTFDTVTTSLTLNQYYFSGDVTSRWESNQYIYFAVAKDDDFDDDNNCTFTINSIVTTYCAAGMIATNDDGDASCSPYTAFTFGTPFSVASTSAETTYYSANLPGNAYGHITFLVNSTSDELSFYAKTGAAPDTGDSGYGYDCFGNDDTEVGDFFIYSFVCPTPIGGNWWYVLINNDDEDTYTATVTISLTTCSTTGGYNCSAPTSAWSPLSPAVGPVTLPINAPYSWNDHTFNYFYYDVNATLPQNPFTFTTMVSSGTGYAYIKYNGYPEDDSPYGYSISEQFQLVDVANSVTWNVYPGDLVTSSRLYFGVETDSDVAMTFSVNGTQTTTGAPTTQAPTSGSNTGNTGNTGNTTGAGFALTASFFLVAVAFAIATFA